MRVLPLCFLVSVPSVPLWFILLTFLVSVPSVPLWFIRLTASPKPLDAPSRQSLMAIDRAIDNEAKHCHSRCDRQTRLVQLTLAAGKHSRLAKTGQ